tara:strand:+ start:1904 stop:2629 length:726 start_codon:yes stop_codon:yes gene_type:complete
MGKIISRNKSIIPACDVPFEHIGRLVEATHNIPEVGAYKIPAISGREGWKNWVREIRMYSDKSIIIDPQKWIPDPVEKVNKESIKSLKESGIDAAIIFPLINFENLEDVVKTAQDMDFGVIVGADMTTNTGEKNYFKGMASLVYHCAAGLGVVNFAVPGTKPESIKNYKISIERGGVENPIFYSPGFIAQGGKITKSVKKAAGERFHPIIGRGIYWNEENGRLNNSDEIIKATLNLVNKLK